MSYLDTLMSQTGLELASSPDGTVPVATIVEVDAQQIAPATTVEPPVIGETRPRPAPEPHTFLETTRSPVHFAPPADEPAPGPKRRTEFANDPAAPEPSVARRPEPAHAEIVIERRVTDEAPAAMHAARREPAPDREH